MNLSYQIKIKLHISYRYIVKKIFLMGEKINKNDLEV